MGNCWGSSPVEDSYPDKGAATYPGGEKGKAEYPVGARQTNVGNSRGNSSSQSGSAGRQRPGAPGGSSSSSSSSARRVSSSVGRIIKPNLKIFTFAELKAATNNFKSNTVLGEGGFGRVYKGWINPTTVAPSTRGVGMAVAVKRCNSDSNQGVKEWKTEVNFLGKFSHPNLVKLIGYCMEEKELLLVYEFMQKGSLEDHLFSKNIEPPSWGLRIQIAMDAARGLDFLHTTENTVIYRDFKAANVLLDENFMAKLSDFGLARLGPINGRSHVTTQAVGTYGYAAPEYIATGHLYVKSDVFCFGVVLLEILTGFRAYDLNRPSGQHSLVEWYKPILHDRGKTKKIIDPRMGEYPPEGVHKLAQLILRCLENDPKSRPSMADVLIILERISTIRIQPSSNRSKAHQTQPKLGGMSPGGHRGGGGSSPGRRGRQDTGPLRMASV